MKEIVLVQKAISKVFGDLVSKAVSDGTDILKSAIKGADQNRESYDQNLLTRLYQITIDALNRFTRNNYRNQDELYDAAESILKGFISERDNTEAIRPGLKMLFSGVSDDTCKEFLVTLYCEICKDDNSDLYKEIDTIWKNQEREYIHGEFERSDQNDREIFAKLNDLKEIIEYMRKALDDKEINQRKNYRKAAIVNRAQEYADKWDKNVFLNDFNEKDEKKGINIKLKDIYLEEHLPNYIWRENSNPSKDLKGFLNNCIDDEIEYEYTRKMILILGQPGIGKSTLITWIMANLKRKKRGIFVYQFARDLHYINWQSDNILNDILNVIDLKYSRAKNKVLILDGFDEINISSDRERILNKLKDDLEGMHSLGKFSLIITCRENYVNRDHLTKCDYITLQAWNAYQIKSFCVIYEKKRENKILETKINKILENKEILGIPLILYMVLALDVAIEENESIVGIYDQIFSLNSGGIYDRCYDVEHRINSPDIKEHIHRISQEIAFWIFENNADEAYIPQQKFEEICYVEMSKSGEKGKDIQKDVLIGNFFKLKHCEGKETSEIQFVHRSIYEYFVALYFCESIHRLTTTKEIAEKMGELLKTGKLTRQLLEFMKCKFESIKEYDLPDILPEIFNLMLQYGMTHNTKGKYYNIVQETNVFSNMLEIVHLWDVKLEEVDNNIIFYLQYNYLTKLNLRKIYLRGVCLNKANLSEADLEEASLEGVTLEGTNLRGANLRGADLRGANLRGANLKGAKLVEASIREANLREADLRRADLVGTDLSKAKLEISDLREANLNKVQLVEAKLRGADLSKASLEVSDLRGADLSRAKLEKAKFEGADLRGVDLRGADLRGADLKRVDLSKADLSEADLRKADLGKAKLGKTKLRGADLGGADLRGAELKGADFSESKLNRANLSMVNLSSGKLVGVDLSGACLSGANLREADLGGADLRGADLCGSNLESANLMGAKLMEAKLGGVNLTKADLFATIFDKEQVSILYKKYELKKSKVFLVEEYSNYREYFIKEEKNVKRFGNFFYKLKK